jgi:VIT1/CCC1 family predicted Fe2+/Mn2+ transporter
MINVITKYSLGSTAAIITSMGIVAGLAQNDSLKMITIASLLTFAIADNISDALGIHIYKESEGASKTATLKATFGNFFTRLGVVLSFVLIVLLSNASTALFISCVWGLGLLSFISYKIAKIKNSSPRREVFWHLAVSIGVIIGSTVIGNLFI